MLSDYVFRALPRAWLALAVLALITPAVPARGFSPPSADEVTGQGGGWNTAFDALAGDQYGYSVAASADWVVVGAPFGDNDGGHDAGSVYVYRRDWADWEWDAKLTANDGDDLDHFGMSVAVFGDTVLVGASNETSGRGAAYVFTRSGDSWGIPQKLTAAPPGHEFGISVALYQDTALVGALDDGTGKGAGYVFTRATGPWLFQGKLTDASVAAADYFGCSVALHQDTAVVGAFADDADLGSAFVFTRAGTTWAKQQKLVASDRAAHDFFGWAVGIDRDTVLAGAHGDDDGLAGSGSAYVFNRTDTTWTQGQKIHAATSVENAGFGYAVSISGDTAMVGAPAAGASRGMACLLTRVSGVWSEPGGPITGPAVGDRLGHSVSVAGGRIAIGAPGMDTAADGGGAAFIAMYEGQHPPGATRVAGSNRYLTAVAASKQQFEPGAPTVVVATGENWPDALGGSSLCGSVYGPMLLTQRATLPAEVRAEIMRLGATKAYVLGGTAAVSSAVEDELIELLGSAGVVRLAGATRYETARAIADEVIRLDGEFDGHVIVATGGNFPDATAVAPVCAFNCAPILLASPAADAVNMPPSASAATILGGTTAVSQDTEDWLVGEFGDANIWRIAGADRYETAAMIAQTGVDHGMMWSGVGLASGTAFPDALSGGVMLGLSSSVLLLTPPMSLSPYTRGAIEAHAAEIDNSMRIIGGTAAVSAGVEADAKLAAGM